MLPKENHAANLLGYKPRLQEALTYADGLFYLYADNGAMALVKPTDTAFEVTGSLKIEDPGKRPTWAHPVVFGKRLYVRYGDKLGVYDVAASVGKLGGLESRQ